MKKVAILQSNYIPWKGYFDIIGQVDDFVFFDDTQYTRRDWRNRNKIKTEQGLLWLTIPVSVKGNFFQTIRDTTISDKNWKDKHWKTICHTYNKARSFQETQDFLKHLYDSATSLYLSEINVHFITHLCKFLKIETNFHWASDFAKTEGKTERLLGICKDLKATHYLSGPAAKGYLDEELFRSEGIEVEWMDYSGYREYPQLYPPFEHAVSIVDLVFNEGSYANKYLKSFCLPKV